MVTSDLTKLTAQVQVERALVEAGIAVDSGIPLGGDDVQTITANSDEYVTIYGVNDGEPRRVLKIDARRLLSKRLRDGRYAFWIPEMGGAAPLRIRGEVRCYLDPDFSEGHGSLQLDRDWIDSIGLTGRVCNMMAPDKGIHVFATAFDRDDHARTKHRREYATIQAAIAARRAEFAEADIRQDREDRRAEREALLALAASVQVAKSKG